MLGAGLGTRLRPLTENLPKPLVPIGGTPLVTHALRHLSSVGVRETIINTHHAAHRWAEAFPDFRFENLHLSFRHEPVLLDTGGGLKNVQDFLEHSGTFWIYNGDILTDLPLVKAWTHHTRQKNLVTMVLRSTQEPRHVAIDTDSRIVDIRGMLGTGRNGDFLFTGIHLVEPAIFQYIPRVEVKSIIPIYLDLIRQGLPVGGAVVDEGRWSDVGTVDEYARVSGPQGPSAPSSGNQNPTTSRR